MILFPYAEVLKQERRVDSLKVRKDGQVRIYFTQTNADEGVEPKSGDFGLAQLAYYRGEKRATVVKKMAEAKVERDLIKSLVVSKGAEIEARNAADDTTRLLGSRNRCADFSRIRTIVTVFAHQTRRTTDPDAEFSGTAVRITIARRTTVSSANASRAAEFAGDRAIRTAEARVAGFSQDGAIGTGRAECPTAAGTWRTAKPTGTAGFRSGAIGIAPAARQGAAAGRAPTGRDNTRLPRAVGRDHARTTCQSADAADTRLQRTAI